MDRSLQDSGLRAELLAMAAEDQAVRSELAAARSLFDGYHPRMEAVHRRNAARLSAILDECGWPGRALVGEDGAAAAWTILQHAISAPALMRRGLALVTEAARHGDAPWTEVAMLEDRICTFEGRPQRYGTQFDWDASGTMSPLPISDPEDVAARRRDVGLPQLDEHTRRIRERTAAELDEPPADIERRRREAVAWARSAGWRP